MEVVEQDRVGGDDLPTYEAAAAQSGPNSRFGRWAGWIEKRATERYQAITDEVRAQQRERGWGNEENEERDPLVPPPPTQPLRIEVEQLGQAAPSAPTYAPPSAHSPFLGQILSPTHLKLNQFGSRFLPHTTTEIHCVLPLPGEQSLLVGHDGGLSVLDFFPCEWDDAGGITQKGPDEAKVIPMWQGETVYQMSLLELENGAEGKSKGVVLALVGPVADDWPYFEPPRTLRMYSLASLTSLAQWSVAQKGSRPITLTPPNGNGQQSPGKRHIAHASMTIKNLKSILESGPVQNEPHTSQYPNLQASPLDRPAPTRDTSTDSSWDVIEDLPLRWATDYVPLAAAGSRLANTSVLSYTLWRDHCGSAKGATLLAVVTKCNILLYEAPKGERAFHFTKDFYVPSQPRSVTFVLQCVGRAERRSSMTHRRSDSSASIRVRTTSATQWPTTYDPQLSLFVIFEKKAGWIRLADAAVGELELFDTTQLLNLDQCTRRPKPNLEKEPKGYWIPPKQVELSLLTPSKGPRYSGRFIYVVTRGRYSHVVPCPLPADVSAHAPLSTTRWEYPPSSVVPRICESEETGPFLQLVAFGEDGLDVQELSLSFLEKGKGKQKARGQEFRLRSQANVGGSTGALCPGGHWHRQQVSQLTRSDSVTSQSSFSSLSSEDIAKKLRTEQGIYGWCRKGAADWRVFWVGGDGYTQADGGDDA